MHAYACMCMYVYGPWCICPHTELGACGEIIIFSAGHLYDPIKFLMHFRIEELINTNRINN